MKANTLGKHYKSIFLTVKNALGKGDFILLVN